MKIHDVNKYNEFQRLKKEKSQLYTSKGYYYSTLGYSNVESHILTGVPLQEKDRKKYDLVSLMEWWKPRSVRQFEKMMSIYGYERIRTEDCFYSPDVKEISIE